MEQLTKKKRPLFCVAVEIFDKTGRMIGTSLEYIHADDIANARYLFRLTAPNTQRHRIAAVAQVVGYKADSKGERLTV